ncbi:membrane dipeptidase [Oceanobacillus sp. J11TS1]|uniref:membrane dipeptidase n=1 Tax=Oceanobacillus sp. J11TS1 TaxID=2807191 RepID=UPI001B1D3C06|nr:membrane dipeptidase [Oceanobacillus sp. J11TS1]GIO24487.1 hypothetical protein J11TS1_30680 [Oceanobacillus sp. J11TS1]
MDIFPRYSGSFAEDLSNVFHSANEVSVFSSIRLACFALYPAFLKKDAKTATIADLCKHIDHVCALGGEKNIGFGSDFDGIEYFIDKVTDASCYGYLINELLKHYTEEQVRGFAYQNFMNLLPDLSKFLG